MFRTWNCLPDSRTVAGQEKAADSRSEAESEAEEGTAEGGDDISSPLTAASSIYSNIHFPSLSSPDLQPTDQAAAILTLVNPIYCV